MAVVSGFVARRKLSEPCTAAILHHPSRAANQTCAYMIATRQGTVRTGGARRGITNACALSARESFRQKKHDFIVRLNHYKNKKQISAKSIAKLRKHHCRALPAASCLEGALRRRNRAFVLPDTHLSASARLERSPAYAHWRLKMRTRFFRSGQ